MGCITKVFVDSGAADALDALVRQANEALVFALGSNFAEFGDQVRMVSLYGLTAVWRAVVCPT